MRQAAIVSCAVLLGIATGLVLSSCGSSVHAATNPVAILSGYSEWYSDNTVPAPVLVTGLGGDQFGDAIQSSAADSGLPMPSGGTLKNLHVAGLKQGDTVTVFVNGTVTAITCTLPTGGGTGGTCSDTGDSVPVQAGDLVAVMVNPPLTPHTLHSLQVALEKE